MKASEEKLKQILLDESGSVQTGVWQAELPLARDWYRELEVPRKLFHLSSALIPLVYLVSGIPREIATGLLLPVFLLIVGSDLLRKIVPSFNRFYIRHFGMLMRRREHNTFNNATSFMVSSMLVVPLFPREVAIVSLLMLSFGDPAAAIFGRRFGEIHLFGKTLEGSFACFQVCFVTALMIVSPWRAFAAGLSATLAELLPLPGNDNLRIPIVTAAVLTLVPF